MLKLLKRSSQFLFYFIFFIFIYLFIFLYVKSRFIVKEKNMVGFSLPVNQICLSLEKKKQKQT